MYEFARLAMASEALRLKLSTPLAGHKNNLVSNSTAVLHKLLNWWLSRAKKIPQLRDFFSLL
ncbi:hypothetical protein DXX93_02775 [Thalassotalea euphylliae]|uniref:Uncharacterized protein n=1 Tax=Thalassotalea euphylliae TaxID=1655234 RepID=A0A3E0TMK3_9GAMM|nr:hypothetical protein DXX93_02775 [Thalassotalea euphylliae]